MHLSVLNIVFSETGDFNFCLHLFAKQNCHIQEDRFNCVYNIKPIAFLHFLEPSITLAEVFFFHL